MVEAFSTDPQAGFLWGVAKDSVGGRQYLRLTAGQWFYDYQTNVVRFPVYYRDPDSHELVSVWQMNSALYLDPDNPFLLKTLPQLCSVEYITGLGVPIDVTAVAAGSGPSYQLEGECVQFISGESDNDSATPPAGVTSDRLPSMGDSVPLKNRSGQTMAMKWHVYNHSPLFWGPSVGWIVGNELPAGGWGDAATMGLFTGNHGFNTADLGPGAALGGTVSGTVTLYGSPSTILSGQVAVYAKAKTVKTYRTATGQPVTTYRRTGGYRSGALVFGLRITDTVGGRRTGVTCGVPRILVYCRERDSDEAL